MEDEAASEAGAEDEDSEADASKCFAKMICVAALRTSVALVVWHPIMDCICIEFSFWKLFCSDIDKVEHAYHGPRRSLLECVPHGTDV